jgi:hypothetical protein
MKVAVMSTRILPRVDLFVGILCLRIGVVADISRGPIRRIDSRLAIIRSYKVPSDPGAWRDTPGRCNRREMLAFLRYMRAMDLELLLDLEHDVQTHARRLVEHEQVYSLALFPSDFVGSFVMTAHGWEPRGCPFNPAEMGMH